MRVFNLKALLTREVVVTADGDGLDKSASILPSETGDCLIVGSELSSGRIPLTPEVASRLIAALEPYTVKGSQ